MVERLSPTREYAVPGSLSPLGIENYPEENGISLVKVEHIQENMLHADGSVAKDINGIPIPEVDSDDKPILTRHERPKTRDEIREEAVTQALGILAYQELTPVDTEPGSREYSALRDEELVDTIANTQRAQQYAEEEKLLLDQLSSLDPRTRTLADAALSGGLRPENIPQWIKMNRDLQSLRSSTVASPQKVAYLERHLKLLEQNGEKEVAQAMRKLGLSTLVNRHTRAKKREQERGARRGGRNMGKNEEETSALTLGRGRDKRTLRQREEAESKQLRNIVSAKGTTIIYGNQTYVVEDVLPSPALAFVMQSRVDPTDPTKLKYEPKVDPTNGEPILKTICVAIKVPPSTEHPDGTKIIPVPRDDRYQSGVTRRMPEGARYCYEDGSHIPTEAMSEESFSYIDDTVELRLHYTAAQAVKAMVAGDLDTSHRRVRIGDLEDYARRNPDLVKHDPEDLKEKFVLKDSEYPTGHPFEGTIITEVIGLDPTTHRLDPSRALAPAYDLEQVDSTTGAPKKASGHFERYTHSIDPTTGRPSRRTQAQIAREKYWSEIVVQGRMKKAYGKSVDKRNKAITGK